MANISIVEVVRAFEVLREIRRLNGKQPPEGKDDPLYPVWVKEIEKILDQLNAIYLTSIESTSLEKKEQD